MSARRLRSWPRLIATVILAVLLLGLIWQGFTLAIGWLFPEQAVATFGTVEQVQHCQVLVVRKESLIRAPASGRFQRRAPAGERVPRRGTIGEITTDSGRPISCHAPSAGLLAYTTDGLEAVLTPDWVEHSPKEAFLAPRGRLEPTGLGQVESGQAIARLVDDAAVYLVVQVKGHEAPAVGGTVWVRLEDRNVPLIVQASVRDKNQIWLWSKTDRAPAGWLDERRVQLTVILARCTGTLIPRSYLRERSGQTGVIVLRRGKPSFVAVKVLGGDGEKTAVSGISEGTILMPH